MKPAQRNLCQALRLIRVYHDMSQSDLSAKIRISIATVSMLESCQRTPSMAMLAKYSTGFDMPTSSILFIAEQLTGPPVSRPVSRTIHKTAISILNWLADKNAQGTAP